MMDNFWKEVWEKHRIRICQAGGLVLCLMAKPRSNFLFTIGFLIALAGECVRVWASGHIHKGEELAQEGPYAMARNPLYFGSFVMSAGFAVMCTSLRHWFSSAVIWAAVLGTFRCLYPKKIDLEELDLDLNFGEAFRRYRAQVPAFWPDWNLWRQAIATTHWEWSQSTRNKEHKTMWAFWGLVLFLRIKMVYQL